MCHASGSSARRHRTARFKPTTPSPPPPPESCAGVFAQTGENCSTQSYIISAKLVCCVQLFTRTPERPVLHPEPEVRGIAEGPRAHARAPVQRPVPKMRRCGDMSEMVGGSCVCFLGASQCWHIFGVFCSWRLSCPPDLCAPTLCSSIDNTGGG